MGMKLSVSLRDKDVEFLDRYAAEHKTTRSGALQAAVKELRFMGLGDQYEAAFKEGYE